METCERHFVRVVVQNQFEALLDESSILVVGQGEKSGLDQCRPALVLVVDGATPGH